MPQGILIPYTLLEKIPLLANLTSNQKAVLYRAFKAAVATFISILLVAATSGVLFPTEWSPIIIIAITTILQAIDKALRSTPDEPPPTDEVPEEIPA
jgi:hypothetical protein